MAMRIKTHVYTCILSIIVIVLDDWGSIAAQQQQQPKGKVNNEKKSQRNDTKVFQNVCHHMIC